MLKKIQKLIGILIHLFNNKQLLHSLNNKILNFKIKTKIKNRTNKIN